MRKPYRGVRRIDTLTAVSRRPHDIDADILLIYLYIHVLCLRHDRHGRRRRMYASAGFGLRNPLDSVYSGFIF